MNSGKIRVTKKQLKRLMTDLRDLPSDEAPERGTLVNFYALDLTLRRAAATLPPERSSEITINDKELRCSIAEDEQGNMTFRFGSHDMTLEGQVLRFIVGNLCKKVPLVRVDAKQVGARIVLTSEERAGLPEGARQEVDLITGGE